MGYRFLKFSTVYPAYARTFAARNPDHAELTYDQLFARFVHDRYALSDHYTRHLRALGHEAVEHVDLAPLQRAWAREHGTLDDGVGTLLAQVRAFHPDVVYLQDLYRFGPELRAAIRRVAGRVLLAGWRAVPTTDIAALRDLDLMFTANIGFVRQLQAGGVDAALLPHAFEPALLDEVPAVERDLPVTFAGSLGARTGTHSQRHDLLEQLMRSSPIEVWGATAPARSPVRRLGASAAFRMQRRLARWGVPDRTRRSLPVVGRAAGWPSDPSAPTITALYPDRCHPPTFGVDYYRLLARSLTTVNEHDPTDRGGGNMRLFEATGMGACLITDATTGLSEHFEPDREVVAYRSIDECVAAVRELTAHPEHAATIAAAGQRRTLAEHTYRDRVQRLDGALSERLAR